MEKKQQLFTVFVARLILKAAEMGYGLTFGEAWRPQPMCDWYAAHGMGITHSNHPKRLAIDLNLFAADGRYLSGVDDYRPLGEWWEQQSTAEVTCCWGGRFAKPDADHFSFENEGVK